MTGYNITIDDALISYCSKIQHCVSTSIAETEYYSLRECLKQYICNLNFLRELNINTKTIEINVDNKAAIFITTSKLTNQKTKCINICYHYVRELIKENKIELRYINSKLNIVDGLTKYLNNSLIINFRFQI